METSVPVEILEKLLRCYSERREADIVFRIRYRREQAGDCVIFQLEPGEELTN
jgi:hypothetical protein